MQVVFCKLKTICRIPKRSQATCCFLVCRIGNRKEIRLMRATADAAAKLVKLGEPETVGALYDPKCKRLEVTTRQDEVYEPGNHESARKKLVFEVSYCRDGRYPGAQ